MRTLCGAALFGAFIVGLAAALTASPLLVLVMPIGASSLAFVAGGIVAFAKERSPAEPR